MKIAFILLQKGKFAMPFDSSTGISLYFTYAGALFLLYLIARVWLELRKDKNNKK